MAKVELSFPLSYFADGQTNFNIEAKSVGELLEILADKFSNLKQRVFTKNKELKQLAYKLLVRP